MKEHLYSPPRDPSLQRQPYQNWDRAGEETQADRRETAKGKRYSIDSRRHFPSKTRAIMSIIHLQYLEAQRSEPLIEK